MFIGYDILNRQKAQGWGTKVIEQLSQDLKLAFQELKGFSRFNLLYMRSFAEQWPTFSSDPDVQQAVGQIPWGHNLVILSKVKDAKTRLAYIDLIKIHGWTPNVLISNLKLVPRTSGKSNL